MRYPSLSLLTACGLTLYSWSFYGCTTAQKQSALADSTVSAQRAQDMAANGQSGTDASLKSIVPRTLTINEATVVLAFEKQMPEKICGRFAPSDLITTLYANEIKPDDRSTFTITDVQVTQLNAAAHTYMAVVKRDKIGHDDECVLDIFAFRDSTNTNPVLAHTTYEPEFADVNITSVQQKKYQITDEEYALAFEWTATQTIENKEQKTTMLCLFRVQDDMMQPIFEVCTYTNVGDEGNTDEIEYEKTLEDQASIETMKTWGKDLYSLLVSRTQTRKSGSGSNTNSRTETRKTKILYQWDGMQYIQTNQLL